MAQHFQRNRCLLYTSVICSIWIAHPFKPCSFPYTIAEGYVLFGVMRTELKVSAFSRWMLVGEIGGQLWAYSLLRPDTQSHKEMLCLAAGTHAPKELEELDLSKQLLWE